jgi:hypothetical protein
MIGGLVLNVAVDARSRQRGSRANFEFHLPRRIRSFFVRTCFANTEQTPVLFQFLLARFKRI